MSVAFYDFFKIYANEKDIGFIRIGLRACTIYRDAKVTFLLPTEA